MHASSGEELCVVIGLVELNQLIQGQLKLNHIDLVGSQPKQHPIKFASLKILEVLGPCLGSGT